jgi:hypothetical protein
MSQLASARIQPFEKAIPHSTAGLMVKWLLSTITQPDPLVVFCFCAVGLAVSFAALAAFADFSSSLAEIGSMY